MKKIITFVIAILILVIVNFSIVKKENHIKNGEVVYLQLAPVDPRSLMQGDYMALRFQIANDIRIALNQMDRENWENSDGYVLMQLDVEKRGTFKALSESLTIKEDEIALLYRVRNGRVKIATNAFFFEEGQGEKYEEAIYGKFRVNEKGEPLLTTLHDKEMNVI